MIKNFIKDIKLSRLSYLLETIEVRDFRSKIKAFNKIKQMKLDNDCVSLILNSIKPEDVDLNGEINISLSLLSLIINDKYYNAEFEDSIEDIFKKLTNNDSKYEILSMLSMCTSSDAILLYKKLLLKYCTNLETIPIGTLSSNGENYSLLFPDLFKALKFASKRNNILLLITDFINYNVVSEEHFKKNKKVIQDAVIEILKEGVNYKFSKDENIMQNRDYIDLRILLEAVINIEYYVSNKTTKLYLEKLFKKKDNQLKLFILENYIKKGKDITKISLNTIAKDPLSRYPLYSFLMFYNLERLMPKKYSNNVSLSESDLYINYCMQYGYNYIPFDFELIDSKVINDYKYYIYKFKSNFNYYDEVKDPATDYILKNTSINKTLTENAIIEYVGISGGYNKDLDPSAIEKNLKELIVSKLDKDQDKIIENLLERIKTSSKKTKSEDLNEILAKEEKNKHEEVKEKTKKKEKKERKTRLEKGKLKGFFALIAAKIKTHKENRLSKKLAKERIKKQKQVELNKKHIKFEEDIFDEEILYERVEEKEPGLLRRIFSFNTLLILLVLAIIGSGLILASYVIGMDIFDIKKDGYITDNTRLVKPTTLKKENFYEIGYGDIFNKDDKVYYVLFFKKNEKNIYYEYLNTILEESEKYKFYYVDISKDENKPIFEGNPTGFIINGDTLLKVNEKEYEFFIVKKENIVKEFKSYVDEIEKKKKEEAQKKKELELQKEEEEKKNSSSKKNDNTENAKIES